MFLIHVLKQLKRRPELLVKLARGIPGDWQPTALFWAIGRESRNNYMATGFYRLHDLLYIRSAVDWTGQEVKNGTVMPDVVRVAWQVHSANVPCNPGDALTCSTHSFASNLQGNGRQVQDGNTETQ